MHSPLPPSDERTRELGAKYTNGDECYPAKVTVGDFLRVTELPGFDPDHTSFFMPTADGPCRFGQYAPFLRKILDDAGYRSVQVLSPTSQNGYADLGLRLQLLFYAWLGGRWWARTHCIARCSKRVPMRPLRVRRTRPFRSRCGMCVRRLRMDAPMRGASCDRWWTP